MRSLRIRPFIAEEASHAAGWKYEAPFDIYNGDSEDGQVFMQRSREGYGYYAVVDDDNDEELVGYCCFGPEGRVKGQEAEPGTLDIGGGIRPDLVSQGIATAFFPSILEFARRSFAPVRFRTAVASFNERSARLCRSAGFRVVRTFEGPGRQFDELVRPAD